VSFGGKDVLFGRLFHLAGVGGAGCCSGGVSGGSGLQWWWGSGGCYLSWWGGRRWV